MTVGEVLGIVLGVVLGAGLGALAWFFRAWANGVGAKVDQLSTKVDRLDDKVDTAATELAQVKVIVGWPPHLSRPARGRG